MIRHLPNLLSALRLAAAPFTAWLILAGDAMAALLVFALAGLSDGLDGFIARRWGAVSRSGAWLDPAADKLLMLFCAVALLAAGAAPWWLVALILARDIAIASGWLMAQAFALPLRLEPLIVGKATTLVQIVYVAARLLLLAFGLDWPRLTLAAGLTTAVFTLLSGAAYARLFLRALWAGHRTA